MAALAHRIRFRINLKFVLVLIGIYQFLLVTRDYFNFESKFNRHSLSDREAFEILSAARHYIPYYISLSYLALIALLFGVYTERRFFLLPWAFIAVVRVILQVFSLDIMTTASPGDYGFEFTEKFTNYYGSFFVPASMYLIYLIFFSSFFHNLL